MIEPSVSYGDAYLKLARELADAFRAGTLAPPAPAAVVAQPVATATPTILPSPTRTFTPAPAPTASPTATSTSTPQPTATPTPAAIPTATPSATPMETPTEAPTPLSSPTATLSVTPTATLPAAALLGVVDQSMATMGVAALALASFLGGFWRRRQSLRQPRRKQRQ
jgi:hypothetical protein